MTYDDRFRTKAAAKLAPIASGGKGQAVTLKSQSNGAYDPATLTQATTETEQSTSGVEDAFRASQIDGTIIQAGDKRFLLSALKVCGAALSPEPKPGDLVTIGGSDWLIISSEPTAPAGLSIMFTLHLRGVPAS